MFVRTARVVTILLLIAAAVSMSSAANAQYTLSANPGTVAPGTNVNVSWTAPAGSSATDWIGVYQVGTNLNHGWFYTGGATAGNTAFKMPGFVGNFEFRYFLNNGKTQVATSNTVSVEQGTFTVSVTPNSLVRGEAATVTVNFTASIPRPANDWVGLIPVGAPDTSFASYAYTGGAQNGSVQLNVPVMNGKFQVKYFTQNSYNVGATGNTVQIVPNLAQPTLTVNPSSQEIGAASITVEFTATTTRTNTDWIGFYEVGAADNQMIQWGYTNGEAGGSWTVNAPLVAGDYEFRYFSNNSYNQLATSNTHTLVTPAGISVTASLANEPGTGIPAIRVQWTAPAGRPAGDWIGLYVVGAGNQSWIRFFYTSGIQNGDVYLTPQPGAGTYELRYFANATYAHVTTSNSVTIP